MAEICCGGVGGTEASSAVVCEPSPRTSRRRRMEIRRLRVVSGVEVLEPLPEEPSRKKQRLDCSADPLAIKQKGTVEVDPTGPESEVGSDSSSNFRLVSKSHAPSVESAPRYGMTSICGRRKDMEDAVSIGPDFLRRGREVMGRYHFFGVYDGHGCSHVAVSCKDRVHEIVAEEMETLGSVSQPTAVEWKTLMERSFSRMDGEVEGRRSGGPRTPTCRCELQTPMCNHVGSTAVVTVVGSDQIVVANCGDSRAVLCRKGIAVPLSCDHKPDRPDELQRIQAAGGRVIYWDGPRVLGVLAMSRAIGDGYLKPFVVSEPEVTITERTEEDECLILASDGMWDVVTNEMACYIVRMCLRINEPVEGRGGEAWRSGSDKACSDAAKLLTKLALARRSSDNVSVVVIDLRKNL